MVDNKTLRNGPIGKHNTEDPLNEPQKTFRIPRASFTAFRLSYASADQLSHLATTIFLGGVPDAWKNLPGSPSFLGSRSKKSTLLNSYFKKPLVDRNSTVSASSSLSDGGVQEPREPGFKLLYQKILKPEVMQRSVWNRYKQEEDVLQRELRRQFNDGSSREEISVQSDSDTSEIYLDCTGALILGLGRTATKQLNPIDSPEERLLLSSDLSLPESSDISSLNQYLPQFSADGSATKLESPQLPSAFIDKTNVLSPQSPEHAPKKPRSMKSVKTVSSKKSHFTIRLSVLKPTPVSEEMLTKLLNEPTKQEKQNSKMVNKLKGLATRRKTSKNKGSQLKVRLLDRIRLFASGEIVRVDKMLVLVKFAPRMFNITHFNDNSDISTIIEERWREYFVVLRRGKDEDEILVAQLYRTGKGKDFSKSSPVYTFDITQEIRVDFYSTLDKSISIINPKENGTQLFIMNARYYSQAIKWLYLIKGCLDEQFYPLLKVHSAAHGFTFRVDFPTDLIKKAIEPGSDHIISKNKTGYQPHQDILVSFVFDKIELQLNKLEAPKKTGLLKENFWLACKFFDRAEWIPNNSVSLIVRSQLFAKSSPLELLKATNDECFSIALMPHSLEGFLGRISKPEGADMRTLRPSYKLHYFVLCQNLLFISKYHLGIPPSPENVFLGGECDREEICGKFSEIFVHTPFELDTHGHISWLESPDFERKDRLALEEYSRKVQHIVTAESVINICLIREVRTIPQDKLPLNARQVHRNLWFSSEAVPKEQEITDTAFEIEFQDGSVLRFCTSSQLIRDEWVVRLRASIEFWNNYRHQETAAMLRVRETNQKHARTDDGIDFRSTFERFGTIEEKCADVFAWNVGTSVLAMSTAVLFCGHLYYKRKKRAGFVEKLVVLCPGYLVLFAATKRKFSSWRHKLPCYERTSTIPISDCYIHTERSTQYNGNELMPKNGPGYDLLPRLYSDGWKSTEESTKLRFTLWCGYKRKLKSRMKSKSKLQKENPDLKDLIKLLSVRAKVFLFQARSRQEQEIWVHNILEEINRFAYE